MAELDHLLWGASDLDAGVAALAAATGLQADPGGVHPGMGTRNALVGLGAAYLEVLAPDPAQDSGSLLELLDGLDEPRLVTSAARTDELDRVVARLDGAGLVAEPIAMSRTTPEGRELRWRLAFVEGHDLGLAVPFLIDWLDTPHPAGAMATQGSLDGFGLQHPRPDQLTDVLRLLGLDVEVEAAADAALHATLDTPDGPVVLRGVT